MALRNQGTPLTPQQQLENAMRATQNLPPIHSSSQLAGFNDALDRANQNVARLAGGTSSSGSGDPIADDLAAIRKLTEGRATDLENDPYNKSANDFLQGVVGGQNVPYTNEVQGAMLAQQGKGFSDAEASSMEALRQGLQASGGSIYDPSYQAASREATSQRQGQNLDAAGRMASQAGLANFDARMSGAGQLSASRNAQNAQINQMDLAGAGYRAMDRRQVDGPQTSYSQSAPAPAPIPNYFQQGAQQAMAIPQAPAKPAPTQTAAPSRGPVQTAHVAPTQQQLTTPWNATNLNPFAQQPPQNYIKRVNPDVDPEGDYQNREQYPYSY